jgi:Na+/H+ antiporter NhaA
VTAISKTFSRAASAESSDVDILMTIALFCGIGLLISLLLIAGLAYLPPEPQMLNVRDWI